MMDRIVRSFIYFYVPLFIKNRTNSFVLTKRFRFCFQGYIYYRKEFFFPTFLSLQFSRYLCIDWLIDWLNDVVFFEEIIIMINYYIEKRSNSVKKN